MKLVGILNLFFFNAFIDQTNITKAIPIANKPTFADRKSINLLDTKNSGIKKTTKLVIIVGRVPQKPEIFLFIFNNLSLVMVFIITFFD